MVAHETRAAQAVALAAKLNARIHMDNGSRGEWENHRRALEAAAGSARSHALILQDDALPVDGFLTLAQAAVEKHPNNPISFYLGTSRPPHWQRFVRFATATATQEDAGWLTCSELLHGVAVAIPTRHIKPLLEWCAHTTLPYDERLGAWFRLNGLEVFYTWPSLVEHQDGPTVVTHQDGQHRRDPRKAWKLGTTHNPHAGTVRIG